MFSSNSRYSSIEDATLTRVEADGSTRDVRYKRRRFVPRAELMTQIAEHVLTSGERLDVITARYLGDPTQFWRLCDANDAMHPEELTDVPGETIRIAFPQ